MSKKSKAKLEEKMILESRRKRRYLFLGLVMGMIAGCSIGYCLRKYVSDDAKKRVAEKSFYRERLGEIKNTLNLLKKNVTLDLTDPEICEAIEIAIETELEN